MGDLSQQPDPRKTLLIEMGIGRMNEAEITRQWRLFQRKINEPFERVGRHPTPEAFRGPVTVWLADPYDAIARLNANLVRSVVEGPLTIGSRTDDDVGEASLRGSAATIAISVHEHDTC
jgi:hypothetical protein